MFSSTSPRHTRSGWRLPATHMLTTWSLSCLREAPKRISDIRKEARRTHWLQDLRLFSAFVLAFGSVLFSELVGSLLDLVKKPMKALNQSPGRTRVGYRNFTGIKKSGLYTEEARLRLCLVIICGKSGEDDNKEDKQGGEQQPHSWTMHWKGLELVEVFYRREKGNGMRLGIWSGNCHWRYWVIREAGKVMLVYNWGDVTLGSKIKGNFYGWIWTFIGLVLIVVIIYKFTVEFKHEFWRFISNTLFAFRDS